MLVEAGGTMKDQGGPPRWMGQQDAMRGTVQGSWTFEGLDRGVLGS